MKDVEDAIVWLACLQKQGKGNCVKSSVIYVKWICINHQLNAINTMSKAYKTVYYDFTNKILEKI